MRYFNRLHPITAFIYFIIILAISMLSMNPIIVSICYFSSILFYGLLVGTKKLLKSLLYSVPLMILIALTNPIFVHKGETILFFLNDNPVTKEAIIYGVFASMMLLSIFYIFKCYTEVMTSDKFVYLFGKVIPKLSLVISLILGFVPKLTKKYKEIDEAQKALGIYSTDSFLDKIRSKIRVFSILITNSLETSVETADSMRARGYGLKGRTSYSIFKFTFSDLIYLIFILVLGILSIALILIGIGKFNYYPIISNIEIDVINCILYVSVFVLTNSSIFMEVKENILWAYLKSKI